MLAFTLWSDSRRRDALRPRARPLRRPRPDPGSAEVRRRGAQLQVRAPPACARSLVVAELGVSLVLLIGAGLLARTFLKLAETNLGFRSDHLLTFRVNPIGPFNRNYSQFYNSVLDRLQHLPTVQSAALLLDIPLAGEDFYLSGRIRALSHPMVPFIDRPVINNTVVSPDFFRTLEIPLKSGRIFDLHDAAHPATPVTNYGMISAAPVVVNQAFVRRIFPGENPARPAHHVWTRPQPRHLDHHRCSR